MASLYTAVVKLALTNLVHRDLSFENVRLLTADPEDCCRIQLIDFDLANEIDPAGTEGKARPRNLSDRKGTKILMPIEILANHSGTLRHQKLHEDEAVPWVGFIGLVGPSTDEAAYLFACETFRENPSAKKKILFRTLFASNAKWFIHQNPWTVAEIELIQWLIKDMVDLQFRLYVEQDFRYDRQDRSTSEQRRGRHRAKPPLF